jgi:hypothetical protein
MKPDLSRIIIQDEEAGYLRLGLSICKKEKKTSNTEKRLPNGFTVDSS